MDTKIESGKIQKIALAYMIAWAISPPIAYGTMYRVLFVLCFVVWDFYAIRKCGNKFLTKQVALFLFLLTVVGISVLADGMSGFTRNLQFILFLMFLAVFYYYCDYSKEDTTWILILVMVLIIIWDFTTLKAYSTIHNVSRLLAKEFDGAEYYARQGVGGFGYVYLLVFIIPLLMGGILHGRNIFSTRLKFLFAITLIMSIAVVVKAGYSIALILMFFSLFIVLFIRRIRNPILTAILCGIVLYLVYSNMENILIFAREHNNNVMYAQKIEDMLLSLDTGEATGTLAGRFERYSRSLSLFFESPIWGQLSYADIGKHSAIIDRFAQFGFLIGMWALHYFTTAQRCVYRMHVADGMAFSVFMTSTAYFLLNNVASAQGVGLFVFYIAVINKLDYVRNEEML